MWEYKFILHDVLYKNVNGFCWRMYSRDFHKSIYIFIPICTNISNNRMSKRINAQKFRFPIYQNLHTSQNRRNQLASKISIVPSVEQLIYIGNFAMLTFLIKDWYKINDIGKRMRAAAVHIRAFHSAADYRKQSSNHVCVFELVQTVQYENEATPAGRDAAI